MSWQNLPGIAVIVLAVAGMGALPAAVNYMHTGEPRKLGRDRWDYEMDKRDVRLVKEEAGKLERAAKLAEKARLEKELQEIYAQERALMGGDATQHHA
jgi:hypothetical protein